MFANPEVAAQQAADLESTLDPEYLSHCLVYYEDMGDQAAARHIYFSVVRHFLVDSDEAIVLRLQSLVREDKFLAHENFRHFALRFAREVETLNELAGEEGGWKLIGDHLKMVIFKMRFLTIVGKGDNLYRNQMWLLNTVKSGYTWEELIDTWDKVWQDNVGLQGQPQQSVYSAYQTSASTQQATTTHSLPSTSNPKMTSTETTLYSSDANGGKLKQKVTRDKDGKPICWQFAKTNQCAYGKKCKFSHAPGISENVNVITDDAQEIMCMAQQLIKMASENAKRRTTTRLKGKFKKTFSKVNNKYQRLKKHHQGFRAKYGPSKSTTPTPQGGGTPKQPFKPGTTYQQAIQNYGEAHPETANVADEELSDEFLSSDPNDVSLDSDDSDWEFESNFMIRQ
jgi:hypothetical protein